MVGQKEQDLVLNLAQQLLLLMHDQEAFVFIKDAAHNYVGCNDRYAHSLGLDDPKQIIGLNDQVLNPLYADLYSSDDDQVLGGKIIEINNPAYFKDIGQIYVVGKILPLRDLNNKVAGIFGTTKVLYSLASKSFAEAVLMLQPAIIPLIVRKNWYIVKTRYGLVKMSRREIECILFLFKSLTAEDIATHLGLSKRSIESYFVNIKNKLSVKSKNEILDTVINGGLLDQL